MCIQDFTRLGKGVFIVFVYYIHHSAYITYKATIE